MPERAAQEEQHSARCPQHPSLARLPVRGDDASARGRHDLASCHRTVTRAHRRTSVARRRREAHGSGVRAIRSEGEVTSDRAAVEPRSCPLARDPLARSARSLPSCSVASSSNRSDRKHDLRHSLSCQDLLESTLSTHETSARPRRFPLSTPPLFLHSRWQLLHLCPSLRPMRPRSIVCH